VLIAQREAEKNRSVIQVPALCLPGLAVVISPLDRPDARPGRSPAPGGGAAAALHFVRLNAERRVKRLWPSPARGAKRAGSALRLTERLAAGDLPSIARPTQSWPCRHRRSPLRSPQWGPRLPPRLPAAQRSWRARLPRRSPGWHLHRPPPTPAPAAEIVTRLGPGGGNGGSPPVSIAAQTSATAAQQGRRQSPAARASLRQG